MIYTCRCCSHTSKFGYVHCLKNAKLVMLAVRVTRGVRLCGLSKG